MLALGPEVPIAVVDGSDDGNLALALFPAFRGFSVGVSGGGDVAIMGGFVVLGVLPPKGLSFKCKLRLLRISKKRKRIPKPQRAKETQGAFESPKGNWAIQSW